MSEISFAALAQNDSGDKGLVNNTNGNGNENQVYSLEKVMVGENKTDCNVESISIPFNLAQDLTTYCYVVEINRTFSGVQSKSFSEGESSRILLYSLMADFMEKNSRILGLFNGLKPVFDGDKHLYTKAPLKLNGYHHSTQWSIKEDQRDTEVKYFTITIRKADPFEIQIPSDCKQLKQEHILVLDIITRYGPTLNKIPIGQKIFHPNSNADNKRVALSFNIECAFGFHQSVCTTESGLALNVDHVTGAFYTSGQMVDVIKRMLDRKEPIQTNVALSNKEIEQLENDMKGLRFRADYRDVKKIEIIYGLTRIPINQIFFKRGLCKGRAMADYFLSRYKIKLNYQNLVCIQVVRKNSYGSVIGIEEFPLELCELVENQFVQKSLPPAVQSEIDQLSEQMQGQSLQDIQKAVETIIKESQIYCEEFGIQFSQNLVKELKTRLPSEN